MLSSDTPRRLAFLRRFLPSYGGLLLLFVAGCASPRPPRPPSLNLPEIVKDLTAERTGDQVTFHWTTPDQSTDRLDIKGALTAEICRISPTKPPAAVACVSVIRLTVSPGPAHAIDSLPQSLTADPPALLAYRIQLFNARGRSAGLSTEVYTAAGAAPSSVDQFRAKASYDGVTLEWHPEYTPVSIELDRQLLAPAPNSAHAPASGASKTPKKTSNTPLNPSKGPSSATEIRLQTPARTKDPVVNSGGVLDPTAARGATYRYTAQSVRTLSIGGHTLILRSPPSAPITLTVHDTFPPAVPTGLEAAPGGAIAPDQGVQQFSGSAIDLSWTPNTDADLAGYLVYRQSVTPSGTLTGPVTRLTPSSIPTPAYRDETAVTGQRYAYRVTAVDVSGNESAPSSDVQETFREP